jgi:hypothetical protein
MENPDMGQIATGMLLLFFGAILLIFAAYLSIKIFLATLSAFYHGFLAIFGFAAGGFIYGPTQTFLVSNLVNIVGDAFSLMAYVIYLGVYLLVLDDLFQVARGNGMAVICVAAMTMIVGVALLRRLDLSLIGGQSRIVGQIRAALAGGSGGGGGGGGPVGGVGVDGVRRTLSPGYLTGLAMREAIMFNGLPLTSFLLRRQNPLQYFARQMQHMNEMNYAMMLGITPEEARSGWMGTLTERKRTLDDATRKAVAQFGGINPRAAAAAISNVYELGGDGGDAIGALSVSHFDDEMSEHARRVYSHMVSGSKESRVKYPPLAQVVAALELATGRHRANPTNPGLYEAGYRAQVAESAFHFFRASPTPKYPHDSDVDAPFVTRVKSNWDRSYEDFIASVPSHEWRNASDDTRKRIWNDISTEIRAVSEDYMQNPTETNLLQLHQLVRRATVVDRMTADADVGPWTTA